MSIGEDKDDASGVTVVPGRRTMRSTRPWVVAGIHRILGHQDCLAHPSAQHRPRLTEVDPDRRYAARRAWRRRLQPRDTDRNQEDSRQPRDAVERPADLQRAWGRAISIKFQVPGFRVQVLLPNPRPRSPRISSPGPRSPRLLVRRRTQPGWFVWDSRRIPQALWEGNRSDLLTGHRA